MFSFTVQCKSVGSICSMFVNMSLCLESEYTLAKFKATYQKPRISLFRTEL